MSRTNGFLTMSVNDDSIEVRGTATVTELNPQFLRVLPGATGITREPSGKVKIALEPIFPEVSRTYKRSQATVNLTTGVVSLLFGDLAYGAMRFLLSAHLAQQGFVTADAAAVRPSDNSDDVILVVGTGKSTVVCRAVEELGLTVVGDDVITIRSTSNGLVVAATTGGRIRSRSGREAHLGARIRRSGNVRAITFVQPSFGTFTGSSTPMAIDASSWLWTAIAGRVFNTRSFPSSFSQPFGHKPSRTAMSALSKVHRSLVKIPSRLLLGDTDASQLRSAFEVLE